MRRREDHLDVLPPEFSRPAGRKRLAQRLFGGEAGGVMLKPMRFGVAVGDLPGGVDLVEEAGPQFLDAASHPVDLDNVDADSIDHIILRGVWRFRCR